HRPALILSSTPRAPCRGPGYAVDPRRPRHRDAREGEFLGTVPIAGQGGVQSGGQRAAFAAITTLFFAWGFITASVDPLLAALKTIFGLSYREAGLTQFAFFIAYGVVSLPAAQLVRRAGYPRAIVFALVVMIVGCLVVPVATRYQTYALVLLALFI